MDYAELLEQHEKRLTALIRRKREIMGLRQDLAHEEEGIDQEVVGLTEVANAYRVLTQKVFLTPKAEANPVRAEGEISGIGIGDAVRAVARRIRLSPAT